MNQNLFSLLLDDGDDPSLDLVKAEQLRSLRKARNEDSKKKSADSNIKQTSNGESNKADQAQRNDRVVAGNDTTHRRNQHQKNLNGGNGFPQRRSVGDSVANRPENKQVYVQKGTINGEERRFNKTSNNQPFRGQRRVNVAAQQQNQQSPEISVKSNSAESNNAGDGNDDWQVVASRKNVPNVSNNINNVNVVNRRINNNFGNGQFAPRRRRSYANSESSNNELRKDDLVAVAAEDSSNQNSTEDDSTVTVVVEEKLVAKEEKKLSKEEEENQRWLAEKKREIEEESKLKTLKEYEKDLSEKNVNSTPKERVAALDKELESMEIVGKRKALLLPINEEVGADSAASNAETDTMSAKDKVQIEKERLCKSIVEVFMKQNSYRSSRPAPQYRDHMENSSGNVKGTPTFSRKGRDNAGANVKGTPTISRAAKDNAGLESASEPSVKAAKTVKRREAEICMNFADKIEFPVL